MEIVGAIVTHNHVDHVGGKPPPPHDLLGVKVPGVARLVSKRPLIRVHVHENDVTDLIRDTGIPEASIMACHDGQVIDVELDIRVLHTPGHTPGSQCILFQGRRLFTGDTLFVGSCGRCDLPGGSAQELARSLSALSRLPDALAVYPGHSYGLLFTSIARERRQGLLNPDNIQGILCKPP
jgi:glyoxylase-like metal-dependent hydrolase (beta-lactamase superfamily II)